eukprot:2553815-Prymnesium_polylepis.1
MSARWHWPGSRSRPMSASTSCSRSENASGCKPADIPIYCSSDWWLISSSSLRVQMPPNLSD